MIKIDITLDPEWKAILQKAWSVKFNVLSVLLGVAEFLVQALLPGKLPPMALAGAAVATSGGALVARILAQKELPHVSSLENEPLHVSSLEKEPPHVSLEK